MAKPVRDPELHYPMIQCLTITLIYLLFQYLVTGAKDGSIKVWDDKGNIKIIFVGHLKSVNTLAVYPFGTYIMSGSSDCTIRVWSLDTADEVDRISTKEPVFGLGTILLQEKMTCIRLEVNRLSCGELSIFIASLQPLGKQVTVIFCTKQV